MIDIRDKKDCCGCNACGDVCASGAISFVPDEEGFLYPKIDATKCVKCGLCVWACPQIHADEMRRNDYTEPKCYATVHKNLVVRFDSTSGGAFSALANVIYRHGGYVGGAIWTEDFHIAQYVSDKKEDLPRLRSSKYAQSDARGFYAAVRKAVATGKPVMVCGTPCQMVALRLFLGEKTPENLFIVDFICRGNNSPLVWRKYLDWQEERNKGKVIYVKPKNKELGWRNLTTKLIFDNKKTVYDTRETSCFTKGYLHTNAYCRPSCYACKYKGLPRFADVTLADFWGANGHLPPELDSDLGTSLVLVNNRHGEILWQRAATSLMTKDLSWESALKGNPMLLDSLPPPKCNRADFFKLLNEQGFGACAERYVRSNENNWKMRIRSILRRGRMLLAACQSSMLNLFRFVRLNGPTGLLRKSGVFIPWGRTVVVREGTIAMEGDCNIGNNYFGTSVRPTAVAVRKGGSLHTRGPVTIMEGADLEVFANGMLELGAGAAFNVGLTIICGDSVKIGSGVKGGRHVTIRDTNGGHWMNMPGYKNTKPIEIGEHVWLCEGCTIMPGVKIGAGAVIGAKAVVFNNVPANALVMGNPAEIVCEQVEWKY